MGESKNDDWADALEKFAGGDVAPSEHEPAEPIEPPPASVPRNTPPAKPPVRAASLRAATPAPRPVVPGPRSVMPPPTTSTSARPQRPVAPTLRPAATVGPASGSNELVVPAIEDQPIVDDDDSVIMPAPDASVFARRPLKTETRVNRAALYRTIEYRQTLIPILLTCGVFMEVFAALRPILGPDSALADLPGWLPIALGVSGVVLLGLAGLNIASVRGELAEKAKTNASV